MDSSASIMSEQDYQTLSARMNKLEKTVTDIKSGQSESFKKLFKELESLKKDNQITIDGDSRHGVRPVREIAEEALTRSNTVSDRIDKILWLVTGISLGAGVSGATIVKIVFGI